MKIELRNFTALGFAHEVGFRELNKADAVTLMLAPIAA
jgi:hypothetical protein